MCKLNCQAFTACKHEAWMMTKTKTIIKISSSAGYVRIEGLDGGGVWYSLFIKKN